ncbi:TPA: OmpH family outer membrane protein [Candidatus Poribacteria bacterium]|nr:OmpH family outer membrane protein [Candidatus Poribacteria bacterium]
MRKKRLIILSAIIAFVIYIMPAFAQSPIRIAVVDTEKVFQDSVWGKKALEEMDKATEGWQKKGEDIEKELTRLEEELTKQRTFLDNKEEEKKLQDQIDSKRLEGQNLIQEGNLALRQKQQELMEPIIQEIKDLIKRIAVEEKYDLVLEKQLDIYKIVLYVNPELDITNKVTAMLDKSYRDKNPEKAKSESQKQSDKPAEKPKETEKKDAK